MSGAGRQDRDAYSSSAQAMDISGDLESTTPLQELGAQYVEPTHRHKPTIGRALSLAILGVGILGAVLLAVHEAQVNSKQTALDASQSNGSALIKSQVIPLNDLGLQPLSALPQTNALTVNGDVDVTGSVLLSPTTPPPSGAVAGQLYFDSVKNQVGYYNGTSFVYLQGGSAAVTNNVTNLNNVTNVTDAITNQYITTGITAINGTAGSLAMFDGIGGLTESLISQTGNNLNTGTGVENVTIGSNSGASTTVVQGGTGNVAINTGDTTGSSGSITIQSGASSTTAAGNVTIDTGGSIISGTVVADKTFEDGVDNMVDTTYGDNSSVTQSSAEARNGTHSLAIAVGGNFFPSWSVGDGGTNPPYKIPVTPGHTYAFTAWVRAATNSDSITATIIWSSDGYGGGGEVSQQDIGTVTDITTGWKQVAGVLTAPVGAYLTGFYFSSGNATSVGEVHYFDDLTVTDLSSSTSDAALNLGATNAQIITIGNSGMLAPTTIYGGGVNINGGTGFVNVSGSNLNATSGGATYSTTSGALDITAATSSTWKVGGSNFAGGNLNIQAGNAGSNDNGGNLILSGGVGAGTGTAGGVVILPQQDSTAAFQIQNSQSTPLLTADTKNQVLTSSGNFIVNTPSSCNYITYTNYAVSLRPYAYWKLEDAGTTAADSSGNNDTGTLSNVTTGITPGPFACNATPTVMAFNAANSSRITTPNTAVAPNVYSEVVMFKSSSASGTFIGDTDGGNHDREFGIDANGHLYSRIYSGTDQYVTSPSVVTDGVWHIGVVTVSSAGMNLYLDGTLVGSNPTATTPQTYNGSWLLGGQWGPSGPPYTGDMAQVAVYTTALNALQVQTLAADSGFYTANLAAVGIGTTTPAANLDDAGSALFHDVNNSSTAFQVQNSSGTDLLSVDTSSSSVNIATATSGTVNIGSIAGSLNFGYTSVGSRQDVGYHDLIAGEQFTASTTGSLTSISAYIGSAVDPSPNNEYQLALYSDNGSNTPSQYLASTAVGAITASSWNTLPISVSVTAGTKYWLVYWTNDNLGSKNGLVYNNVPGNALYYAYTNGVVFGSGADNGMPASFPTPSSDTNQANFYSLYASYGSGIGTALNVDNTGSIHANGSAVFEEATNSTSAFEIQNSNGSSIFSADTANAIISVINLVAIGTITVDGHLITGGSTPTYTAGVAACTTPTITVSGNDTSGTISVLAGSACTSGNILTINFASKFGFSPHVVITPGSSLASGLNAYVDDSTISTSGFAIGTSATPVSGDTYTWNYFVVQ